MPVTAPSRRSRRRIFTIANGTTIKVYRSKTEWVRGRDWAIGKSEELIKKKLVDAKITATVKYEAGKDYRKITVDATDAFVQRFADTHGYFTGDFEDLWLP